MRKGLNALKASFLAILEERLRGRGTDVEEVIQKRMALVDRELAAAKLFDYAVVNDDLEKAVDRVLEVIDGIRTGRHEEIARIHGRPVVLAKWEATARDPA